MQLGCMCIYCRSLDSGHAAYTVQCVVDQSSTFASDQLGAAGAASALPIVLMLVVTMLRFLRR